MHRETSLSKRTEHSEESSLFDPQRWGLPTEAITNLADHLPEHCPEVDTSKSGIYYPVDKATSEGKENHKRWAYEYGAIVICPPKRNAKHPWSKSLRVWVASIRQIIETGFDKLLNTFRFDRERPLVTKLRGFI